MHERSWKPCPLLSDRKNLLTFRRRGENRKRPLFLWKYPRAFSLAFLATVWKNKFIQSFLLRPLGGCKNSHIHRIFPYILEASNFDYCRVHFVFYFRMHWSGRRRRRRKTGGNKTLPQPRSLVEVIAVIHKASPQGIAIQVRCWEGDVLTKRHMSECMPDINALKFHGGDH